MWAAIASVRARAAKVFISGLFDGGAGSAVASLREETVRLREEMAPARKAQAAENTIASLREENSRLRAEAHSLLGFQPGAKCHRRCVCIRLALRALVRVRLAAIDISAPSRCDPVKH